MDNNSAPLPQKLTSTEERVLKLLGDGIKPEVVAAHLGITPARISQLLSDEDFKSKVAELRYNNLAKHNQRDNDYDATEDQLLEKFKESIQYMHRPMELLKSIQIINGAKRRGTSAPESITEKQTVLNLVIPVQLVNKFQTNMQGQVTQVGETQLLTIQSGSLDNLVKEKKDGSAAKSIGTLEATISEESL